MRNAEQDRDILICKFLSGNISKPENENFILWLNESPENKKIFERSKKAWEESKNRISDETLEKDRQNLLKQAQRIQNAQFVKAQKKLLWYKIAAVIAIPLTFVFSWYFFQQNYQTDQSNQNYQVTAPKGHVAKCFLPDGSQIWINTNSTISYNTSTFNNKSREVTLQGEAYFEIAKNQSKPFKVITSLGNINVTGTSFNVKAYPESETIETVLSEGRIELELKNDSHQKINMLPGEKVFYQLGAKEIIIDEVEADFFTAWRNGEILFRDATLNDLIKELEHIYDIQFHLNDSQLGEFRFRGMFSYNNNLIDALEKIKRTANINYYIENKEVWLFNN